MTTKISIICVSGLLLLPVFGQEPPQPPETPPEPQAWWPTQPKPLPFVHTLFSDNMVLQREIADPIWGWSKPGDTIAITVENPLGGNLGAGARAVAVAGADGKWQTTIGPFPAGGPLILTIKGAMQQVVLTNVLVGDVWLCSGQSNMNWPVRLSRNGEEEAKQATNSTIRSFTVGFYPSLVPMPVPPEAVWEICTPETARNFSGVGYFFAREIEKVVKIPIGILHSSVGATTAEVWISGEGLRKYMPFDFRGQLDKLAEDTGDPAGDYFQDLENWIAAVDPESAQKKYASGSALNTNDWRDITVPATWEKAGLGEFDGLVWYRKNINIPPAWSGKPMTLALGQINDTDITWFNGTLIGCTQIKGKYRTYKIDGALIRPGTNLLVVAIINRSGPGGLCSSAPQHLAIRAAGDTKGISGTWKVKPSASMEDISLPFPRPKAGYYKTITAMYNGMIAPLTPFAIKGALWYQGGASWPFWLQYRRLLPALISDWRDRFGVGEFPFLIVSQSTNNEKQTHPVEPGYGEIRESQWRTVRKVPNTGLVITTDLGDEPVANIHPKNKQDVGLRLSLVARNLVYGEKALVYSGPEFTEMMLERKAADPETKGAIPEESGVKEYQARLYFKHVGSGLVFKPGNTKPNGFVVAGEDKQFVWADAVIEGDTVVVSAPGVPVPRCVRYGWAYNPITTLFNKEGLPAGPFRTDE